MFSKIKHKLTYINFILLLFFFLILGVSYSSRVSAVGSNPYENLKIFSEVLSLVQSNYVTEIEAGKLIEGAIKGMLPL